MSADPGIPYSLRRIVKCEGRENLAAGVEECCLEPEARTQEKYDRAVKQRWAHESVVDGGKNSLPERDVGRREWLK